MIIILLFADEVKDMIRDLKEIFALQNEIALRFFPGMPIFG
jgi:hypothetical protein